MLRALLGILRTHDPLQAIGERFARMLKLTLEMTLSAGNIAFGGDATPESRTRIYDLDVEVNQLERSIRKRIVAHLSIPGSRVDVPYCLLLMSLAKDVERLGDYAKNLSEVVDVRDAPLPDDEVVGELREIRRGVEAAFQAAAHIFEASDREQAMQMIQHGRDMAHRCDALITRIGRGGYDGETTTALVLATRFYKRIGGHVMNILSSVVMPLHKIDYYDEDELAVSPE
ncbi:MAG: PhoU domain-containing protein [Vicinamibacterales bacterium]|jgi:phosphate uptake regulator|nr:PhoU domain-containing protein [Vicinamibacterales bacterium]